MPIQYYSPDAPCSVDGPSSIASLPGDLNRLSLNFGCEEMANAMTDMVLNDEKGI